MTGSALVGARMVATVRCAPPANKPTVAERDTCAPWINRELRAARAARCGSVVALGAYGWDGALRGPGRRGVRRTPAAAAVRARRRADGARAATCTLLGCYHPSQHNTFTGRLTPAMLDDGVQASAGARGGPSAPDTMPG